MPVEREVVGLLQYTPTASFTLKARLNRKPEACPRIGPLPGIAGRVAVGSAFDAPPNIRLRPMRYRWPARLGITLCRPTTCPRIHPLAKISQPTERDGPGSGVGIVGRRTHGVAHEERCSGQDRRLHGWTSGLSREDIRREQLCEDCPETARVFGGRGWQPARVVPSNGQATEAAPRPTAVAAEQNPSPNHVLQRNLLRRRP